MDIGTFQKWIKKYAASTSFANLNSRPKVYRHWEIILVGFIMLNVVILGLCVYLFLQVNEGNIFLVEQSQQVRVESIDRGRLEELLTSFEVRDSLFGLRKNTPIRIDDPSR